MRLFFWFSLLGFFHSSISTCLAAETVPDEAGKGGRSRVPITIKTGSTNEDGRRSVDNSIETVAASERKDLHHHINTLITKSRGVFYRGAIIGVLAPVAESERADVLKHSLSVITDDMRWSDCKGIIEAVASVEESEREEFIKHSRSLFTEDMRWDGRMRITRAFSSLLASEREEFINQIPPLLTDHINGDGHSPSTEENPFFIKDQLRNNNRSSIFDNHIKEDAPIFILEAVASVEASKRKEFIKNICSLFTESMPEYCRIPIFAAIHSTPKGERSQRIERAAIELVANRREGLSENDRYVERIRLLLDTPVDMPFPPLRAQARRAPAAAHPAAGQEAIHGQATLIIDSFRKVTENNRIKSLMPTDVSRAEFLQAIEAIRERIQTLVWANNFKKGQASRPKNRFRLDSALYALGILSGKEHGHQISGPEHYEGIFMDGLPKISQLVVLANRLFSPTNTRDYVIAFLKEDPRRWDPLRNTYKEHYPHINYNDFTLALSADEDNRSLFMEHLVRGFSGDRTVLPSYRKWISHYQNNKVLQEVMPLVEALFMISRGHAEQLWEGPHDPACAVGAGLGLLRAIGEYVEVELPHVELKHCVNFPVYAQTASHTDAVEETGFRASPGAGIGAGAAQEGSLIPLP